MTDYAALGFKCGLEIHQQLATGKLFCRCPTTDADLDDEAPDFRFSRHLRPTQSELGEVDAAAATEAMRRRRFRYLGFHSHSCLVDADEEPPHPANEEALDVTLTMAGLFESRPVDEVQWMRKIVIDGSNTTGFQRTGLVATGGHVEDVGIQTIALEEDSARRVGEADGEVVFALDRLGVPLIEIATDPDIRDPEHAKAVAARIGALLRSTGRVKRGLGTIRQDLNVSIEGSSRVEVKGVQELNAIPRVIEYEVGRHRHLLGVRDELAKRNVDAEALSAGPTDVTDVFAETESSVLRGILKDKKARVQGVRLPGFHGLIKGEDKDAPRLGKELADCVRKDAGLRGLLHGDELPGMGITQDEVDRVREALSCQADDSFLLVAAPETRGRRALEVALSRARQACQGVPGEVRQANPDDTTSYLRPIPGAARMYPETDVPPIQVAAERWKRIQENLPDPPEVRIKQLTTKHGLHQDLAGQVVDEGLDQRVLMHAEAIGDATLVARTLLATVPEVEAKGHPVTDAHLDDAFAGLVKGSFAKEGLPKVLEALADGTAADVEAAVESLGLGGVDEDVLLEAARKLVAERADFVAERGESSVGPLMGVLMKEMRGKVDGAAVNQALAQAVREATDDGA